MSKILIFITTGLFAIQLQAQTNNPLQEETKSLMSGASSSELKKLAASICRQIAFAESNNVTSIAHDIESTVLKHNGWDRSTPNYQKKFTDFLNKNSQYFICENQAHRYEPQHIYKRVIAMKFYTPILSDFLLGDETVYATDINVITDNETVLDYIDRILSRPNAADDYDIDELNELKEVMVEYYNAKHAKDLIGTER